MKRLFTVLFAAMLAMTVFASAMAAGSIGDLTPAVTNVEQVQPAATTTTTTNTNTTRTYTNTTTTTQTTTETTETEDETADTDTTEETELVEGETETAITLPEDVKIEVSSLSVENIENTKVAAAVTSANEAAATVRQVVEQLEDSLPQGTELSDTGVLTIPQADGTTKTLDTKEYTFVSSFAQIVVTDGATESFDLNGQKLAVRARISVPQLKDVKNADLVNYQIMVVDPATGELYFLDLDADSFDSETGELTVDFPTLGAFAVIEKGV